MFICLKSFFTLVIQKKSTPRLKYYEYIVEIFDGKPWAHDFDYNFGKQ